MSSAITLPVCSSAGSAPADPAERLAGSFEQHASGFLNRWRNHRHRFHRLDVADAVAGHLQGPHLLRISVSAYQRISVSAYQRISVNVDLALYAIVARTSGATWRALRWLAPCLRTCHSPIPENLMPSRHGPEPAAASWLDVHQQMQRPGCFKMWEALQDMGAAPSGLRRLTRPHRGHGLAPICRRQSVVS